MAPKAKVVLTADSTVMSSYGNKLFYGFLSTAPKRAFKILSADRIMRAILKKVPTDAEGRAKIAPQGLRRIESALVGSGMLTGEEVVVAPAEYLSMIVTGLTKVIGIAVIDPLGQGPSSSTFGGNYGVIHEETINAAQFRNLMGSDVLRWARRNGAKVVVGGPGVWQLGANDMGEFGIDVLIDGEADLLFPKVVKSIMDGELQTPAIIKTAFNHIPDAGQIYPLIGGTIGGLVEISRGCGRGCSFCMPTLRKIRHRPMEDIVADVKTNIRFGMNDICLHAEDVLRYGTTKMIPDTEKVVSLFKAIVEIPNAGVLSVSHTALASIASSPQTVSRVSDLAGLDKHNWMGFQTGIETGSTRIMQNLMKMKPAPFKPSEWPHVVETAFAICAENHWVPAATLLVNLPGEAECDVLQTIDLIDNLYDYRSLMVPLLYVPLGGDTTKPMRVLEDAKYYHFELYRSIWKHDMRWLREIAHDYGKNSSLPARLAISAIVNFTTGLADSKVLAYLDGCIEKLRPKDDAALSFSRRNPKGYMNA